MESKRKSKSAPTFHIQVATHIRSIFIKPYFTSASRTYWMVYGMPGSTKFGGKIDSAEPKNLRWKGLLDFGISRLDFNTTTL